MRSDYEANQPVAAAILRDRCWGDRSFDWGEHVILLDGCVVGVTQSALAALRDLRRLEPDYQRGMVVRVQPETVDIIRRSK